MKKKRKKRKLKSDKQKAEIILWELVKKYIRQRDKMICQKCDKEIQSYIGSDGQVKAPGADTSHVFCKNVYKSLKYDEYNLKLMCMACHKWWHNVPIESSEWFKEKFPHRWDYLQKEKIIIKKMTIVQIEELIEFYTDALVGQDLIEIRNL